MCYWESILYCQDGEAPEQAAQRGCGFPVPKSVQELQGALSTLIQREVHSFA